MTFLRYPIDESFKLLGKEWAGPVIMELFRGTDRFNTLLKTLPGISPRTLSIRLDDLERAGLAVRTTRDSGPQRVRYQLTSKGEDMRHLIREMAGFSLRWFGEKAPGTGREKLPQAILTKSARFAQSQV